MGGADGRLGALSDPEPSDRGHLGGPDGEGLPPLPALVLTAAGAARMGEPSGGAILALLALVF
jgi:hypothetical protein